MKLQTQILLKPEKPQIDYNSKVLLLGSCFSENIGTKFDYFKFQNIQNPFGVIFNPVSIEKLVVRAIDNLSFSDKDVFQHNGIWKCFEAHSELSSLQKDEFLENLNSALQNLREALFSATHIIFTYGTAWVYRDIEADIIVANCHKLPQKQFSKELLSISEVFTSLKITSAAIQKVNTEVTVIHTVSPVRHLKDGFVENSQSKAHLLTAVHKVVTSESKQRYFPAYEIMIDELRDYRFYTEDMLHPNKIAIEIIWEKFSKVWVSSKTISIQKEIESIQSSLLHKPFNPSSKEHQQFLNKLQIKIKSLQKKLPQISF